MALSPKASQRNDRTRRVLAAFYAVYEKPKGRFLYVELNRDDAPFVRDMSHDDCVEAADRLVDLGLLERHGMSTYKISADGVNVSESEDRLRELLPVLTAPDAVMRELPLPSQLGADERWVLAEVLRREAVDLQPPPAQPFRLDLSRERLGALGALVSRGLIRMGDGVYRVSLRALAMLSNDPQAAVRIAEVDRVLVVLNKMFRASPGAQHTVEEVQAAIGAASPVEAARALSLVSELSMLASCSHPRGYIEGVFTLVELVANTEGIAAEVRAGRLFADAYEVAAATDRDLPDLFHDEVEEVLGHVPGGPPVRRGVQVPLTTMGSIATTAWALDVSFVHDAAVRVVLERDTRELAIAQREGLHTAAIVLAGAIGEGILYDALVHRKAVAMTATSAPRDKAGVKDIETDKWSFYAYIEVAKELQILAPSTAQMIHAVLREFRNMIHPKVQVETRLTPDEAEMKASVAWLEAVARDVRKSP